MDEERTPTQKANRAALIMLALFFITAIFGTRAFGDTMLGGTMFTVIICWPIVFIVAGGLQRRK
ncbi:MAG: hypothetical protein IH859_08885 [Chloroflexi bacterium]|nr:hypothetical protein [Chloroflexota bacterium]